MGTYSHTIMCKSINASMLLLIAGLVFNVPRSLGYTNPIDSGSAVTVTNIWTVPGGELFVGQTTPDNALNINHGVVHNTHGFIGSYAGSSNNTVSLTRMSGGSDSAWYNSESLYLGGHKDGTNWVDGGSGNALSLLPGCWVFVGEMDTNAQYDLSASIVVGDASGTPEMVIANGSYVWAPGDCYLGYGTNESGSVEIRGEGSVWEAGYVSAESYPLHIGYRGSGNKLTVSDGGLLDADIAYIGFFSTADNNMVLVTGEGSRLEGYVEIGSFGSGNRLEVSDGGLVHGAGAILGHWNGSDHNSVLVTGTGSALEVDSLFNPIVVVGSHGKGNTLTVSDGGEIRCGDGVVSVGRDSGSDSNAVFVSGNGSVIDSGSFYLGGQWNVGGRGNGLYVDDGGLVSVGEGMFNRNYSTVSVDGPGSRIEVGGNYYQDASSILRLGISSNGADSAFLSVGGTAEFEAGATVQYQSDIMLPDFETVFTNLLVEADQLIVAGVTNAHDLDLEVVKLDSSLVELELWGLDQNMYGLLSRRHLAESAGFAPGSQMALVSGEIDALSVQGNALAVNQINLLNGMSSSQQNAQLTQRYEQGTPSYRHNQTLIGGRNQVLSQSRHFQSSARSSSLAPSGPSGPHQEGQGLRGWIQGYGSWADYDGTTSFSGFDHHVYGTVIGLDKAFGNLLLGVAGGYARSDLTQDNDDSSDAKTGYGMLYASLGTVDWFGDLLLSYGRSRVENESGTMLGGSGSFTADNFACYMGGGREIPLSVDGNVVLTPEAAFMADYYDQPEYTDGLMKVEDYDRWSVQTKLGASLSAERSLGSFVIKPELRAYWLHEFDADSDQVDYALIGGTGRYSLGVQAPVDDLLEVGLGLTLAINDRIELVFDVDSQYSDQYQTVNASSRISYEF